MSDSDSSLPKISTLAPWRSPLARALHRNRSRPYSRYFQLATVTALGRPANRTVVFRSWLPDTDTFTAITDQRSAKVADMIAHPWGEICWYFTHTREQFRLGGPLGLVTASATEPTLVSARSTSPARRRFLPSRGGRQPPSRLLPGAADAPPGRPPRAAG
jgi:PPOX class probable FMN-dependent enzyme